MSAATGTTGHAVYLGELRIVRDTTSVLADSHPSVHIQSIDTATVAIVPLDQMAALIAAAKAGALDHLVSTP